jgi:hypothetical protein
MNASSPDVAQHQADAFSLMANLTKRWLLKPDIMPCHSKHRSISFIMYSPTSSLRRSLHSVDFSGLVIIDHADVIDPDDCRAALGDKTLCAPSQSLVAALKLRAVVFVLANGDRR